MLEIFTPKTGSRGRYDASYGWFLKGNGDGNFTAVEPEKSGFIVRGEARDMGIISKSDSTSLILTAINDKVLRLFNNKKSLRNSE